MELVIRHFELVRGLIFRIDSDGFDVSISLIVKIETKRKILYIVVGGESLNKTVQKLKRVWKKTGIRKTPKFWVDQTINLTCKSVEIKTK